MNPEFRDGQTEGMRRVLVISYHFPPVGGAGVQRPIKFCKYLREYGWEPTVLTASNPSAPLFDESLCRDLPEGLQIERARTWEPDYRVKQNLNAGAQKKGGGSLKGMIARGIKSAAKLLLQPDPQILWLPEAYRVGLRILKQQKYDAILATAPTYTNFLLGALLKRKFGIPLLLDYRDEWDLSSKYLENRSRDWYSTWVQERQQRFVLKQADALIATTEQSTEALRVRAEKQGRNLPGVCIYNGYDAEDFEGIERVQEKREGFRLTYTGTLWNLTSVEPIVQAIERLSHSEPELCRLLEFECIGRKLPEQQVFLDRLKSTECRLICEEYQPHADVLRRMVNSDAQCLLLSDVPGAERVVPGKLFEYLAAGSPILAVMPRGETSRIVDRFYAENVFVPRDVEGILQWLKNALRMFQAKCDLPRANNVDEIEEYSRVRQTSRLADILNEVSEKRIDMAGKTSGEDSRYELAGFSGR